ncbi:MAG: nucleoside-diphosphate sugar epimerase, partial [Nitrosomonadales bacterium]|nr:nucleoside-diphosphate sugar epimerase [Nitrosomonadales bacterium]
MRQNKKINIWLIKDNKRGHDKQSEALANAIRAISNVEIIQIKYQTVWGLLFDSFLVFMGKKIARKKPDLIIGAGHSTHARMIVSKLFFGGRTIVIMKPSLPIFCFDLCLIPSHDRPKVKSNVIKTNGAINNIDNESRHSSSVGLILIGGKSKYFV